MVIVRIPHVTVGSKPGEFESLSEEGRGHDGEAKGPACPVLPRVNPAAVAQVELDVRRRMPSQPGLELAGAVVSPEGLQDERAI